MFHVEIKSLMMMIVVIITMMINSFGAEVAKSRHNGLNAEVDYSRPLGNECCRLYTLSTEVD